jgi:tRNA A37 threonylcarbamoyladenosine dehydratase
MAEIKNIKARFDRVFKLFGNDFYNFKEHKILLLGVGGVGGFCLDCLYRTGFENITIVDFDTFDETNQNRQLESENLESLNKSKVDVFAKKYPNIKIINSKIDTNWIESFDFSEFDSVLDAIDDIPVKVELPIKISNLNKQKNININFISSMGSAMKTDPTMIQVTDIWKTKEDGLARRIRSELRKRNFKNKYKVIFSEEKPKGELKGSFIGVTASFGLAMCSEVVNFLTS